jgi:flagellum-specific peptidoglycan hydrolase FlgJ
LTFWQEALPYAQQAHEQTGVLTSVILAQWGDETGYGGVDWSVDHNPGNVGSYDGQPVRSFPTLQDGVNAYIQTMNNGLYNAVKAAKGWEAQCYALGASPWASGHYEASGPPPGQDLIKIVQANDLTQYDSSPAPSPVEPQEVDMFLTTDPTGTQVWLCDVANKRWVESPTEEAAYSAIGIKQLGEALPPAVFNALTTVGPVP